MIQRIVSDSEIHYPESDGEPIAENTLQRLVIDQLHGGIAEMFAHDPNVFVAGDLLWYPIEGDPLTNAAPDLLVAFGRPKGHRGSYKQWEEGHTAPQVTFEVLSPSNTEEDMILKRANYEKWGVEEHYEIDPELKRARGWIRRNGIWQELPAPLNGWTSPRLGLQFIWRPGNLQFVRPDGRVLEEVLTRYQQAARAEVALGETRSRLTQTESDLGQTRTQLVQTETDLGQTRTRLAEVEAERERQRVAAEAAAETARQAAEERDRQRIAAEAATQAASAASHQARTAATERDAAQREANAQRQQAEAERLRAEEAQQRAEAERQRAERLAELLRQYGIDPP